MEAERGASAAGTGGSTLKRPVRIVKKRSGPLEDTLEQLHNAGAAAPVAEPVMTAATAAPTTHSIVSASPAPGRRRPTIKEKEKKRERWLLTRKTWKYMTDAGRKLIPDSAQNRKEDIPNIEAHFQQVCAAEPRFILWRRKSSYPGATRNSKRRLKQLLQHTGQKSPLSQDAIEQEEAHNADHVIDLLSSYLKLEACKTTTLLGSKTVRPDQTASPSAQRPGGGSSGTGATAGLRGPGFLTSQRPPKNLQQLSEIEQLLERLRTLSRSASIRAVTIPPEHITPALLEDKALLKQIYNSLKKQQLHRILNTASAPSARTSLKHSTSLSSLLHFGGVGGGGSKHHRHADTLAAATGKGTRPTGGLNVSSASPLSTCASPKKSLRSVGNNAGYPVPAPRQRKPPSTLDLPAYRAGSSGKIPVIGVRAPHVERQYNSCGTQTNFVPLHEVKRLAEEYKEERKRIATATSGTSASGTPAATDDEAERNVGSGSHHHRRKSSIDNEDVSQSVSDTIKRYLRMARKKSVHDDNANRFKRVNYDRNLRNIRAKGEINPPGMDEDNSKAVQTLDAWAVITLDFIRGNENSGILETAHAEWRRALDERIQKKLEYEQKLAGQSGAPAGTATTSAGGHHKQSVSSCSSSSAPTSPTFDQYGSNNALMTSLSPPHSYSSSGGGGGGGGGGLRLAGSQFLSHLLYGSSSGGGGGATSDQHDSSNGGGATNHNLSHLLSFQKSHKGDCSAGSNNSTNNANSNAAMQKSKSSSNVGQFVSRKILKSRSKSQTRSATQTPLTKWAPSDKFTWTSDNGDRIVVLDTCLQNLTDAEAKILQRVAIEKISELNIGVNVSVDHDAKSQKRRVLPKKKAMTTTFFDIGRKDEQSGSLGIFGNTLECCVANDHKRTLKTLSERGSRNSIASLFRSSVDSAAHKNNENVCSYESLPTSTFSLNSVPHGDATSSASGAELGRSGSASKASHSGYFSNLAKSASMQISRSQSDVRRKSQELDLTCFELQAAAAHEINRCDLQVPNFVMSCIRYLEDNGLHQVGLFRVSTSKKRVKQMREDFDKNPVTNIHTDTCPHDVATLLKEFLRDLPEPLLCSGLYKAFLETQRIRNRRLQLEAISHLVKLLPPAHRDTLYVLLKFLAKVAASSDDVSNSDGVLQVSGNKMDSNNLATVFAPNILRKVKGSAGHGNDGTGSSAETASRSGEQESMSDAINVIRIMIDHYEEIFKVPAELIDIVYSYMLDVCPEKLYSLCEQRSRPGKEELGTSCSSLSSPDQALSPTSTVAASISSGGPGTVFTAAPKRLYTRESVMHDNDASRAGPESVINGANGGKRYFDSHSNRSASSGHSAMPSPSSRTQRLDDLVDAINRRQSSPNILGKSGVVSASLQIPMPVSVAVSVPMPTPVPAPAPALMHTPFKATVDPGANDLDEVFYRGTTATAPTDSFPYSDIPYIEDAVGGQGIFNECLPISGSLSFTPKMEVSLKERQPQQQQQQQKRQQHSDNTTFRIRKSSADAERAAVELGCNEPKRNPASNEPKLPTSISSIGGAILRSKTADFERMSLSKQQQQQQQQKLQHYQQQQQALADRQSHSGSNSGEERGTRPSTAAPPGTTTTIRTHLYKRQELIPSAKRSISKK